MEVRSISGVSDFQLRSAPSCCENAVWASAQPASVAPPVGSAGLQTGTRSPERSARHDAERRGGALLSVHHRRQRHDIRGPSARRAALKSGAPSRSRRLHAWWGSATRRNRTTPMSGPRLSRSHDAGPSARVSRSRAMPAGGRRSDAPRGWVLRAGGCGGAGWSHDVRGAERRACRSEDRRSQRGAPSRGKRSQPGLVRVRVLVVLGEQVPAEVSGEVAPHRADVVRPGLGLPSSREALGVRKRDISV